MKGDGAEAPHGRLRNQPSTPMPKCLQVQGSQAKPGGTPCILYQYSATANYLCSPSPAFWISITFRPISRSICCRHLSASLRSLHSVAKYGLLCFGPRCSSCFPARNLLSMDCAFSSLRAMATYVRNRLAVNFCSRSQVACTQRVNQCEECTARKVWLHTRLLRSAAIRCYVCVRRVIHDTLMNTGDLCTFPVTANVIKQRSAAPATKAGVHDQFMHRTPLYRSCTV